MPNRKQPGSKDARTYVSGRFELELDGHSCGVLTAVDGGHFKSEPIGEQVGGDHLVTRYPGRQKFEDITLTVGSAMSPQFWTWVKSSIDHKPSRRNGAIVARDFDNRERSRRTFKDALIAEVGFPQLDAASKGPKQVTVKISPETMSYAEGSGAQAAAGSGDVTKQKQAIPSNFRVTIDGIDADDTKRVSKVDAFAIKQNIITAPVGGLLYAPKEAGRMEFPTLTVYVPESHAEPWVKWWEKFVGAGEHIGKNERTGSITYLDSSLTKTLLQIELQGVGITGLTFDKLDAQTDKIRQLKVDLYVESMSLKV